MTENLKIIIADDHLLFREGLKGLFEIIGNTEIVGEAANGRELMEVLKQIKPDLIFLDLQMPDMTGFECLPMIKNFYPFVKVLVLSMHEQDSYINAAIRAGADGYLLKNSSLAQVRTAIAEVGEGRQFLPECIKKPAEPANTSPEKRYSLYEPTESERKIIRYICQGLSSKVIADKTGHTTRTIETYRHNILVKLETNYAGLIQLAIDKGWNL